MTPSLTNIIRKESERVFPWAAKIRREFHKHPELSGQEHQTAAAIKAYLESLDIKAKLYLNKTGVVGTLKNGPEKTVVLRADTDALPLQEENDISFRSVNKGIMHACGHDIHMTSLLGAAKVLSTLKKHWSGTVVFLFQPHEEAEPGGAERMIKAGAFPSNAHAVFGLHVSPQYSTGQIGIKPGDDYSGNLFFDVAVEGKGGHGAEPEKTVDPIVCAAAMILELQSIVSREIPPYEPAVLSIGSIHAGAVRNIIPDKAVFKGTIRAFSDEVLDHFIHRVKDVTSQVAQAHRANVSVSINRVYPAGHNDESLSETMIQSFGKLLGTRKVIRATKPVMVSEDFSYYQRKAPGLFAHLGVRPPKKKIIPGLHNARFLPDEQSLSIGMAAHVCFTLELLGR